MQRVVTRGFPDEATKESRWAKMAEAAARTRAVRDEMRETDAILADLSKATSSETITHAGFSSKMN